MTILAEPNFKVVLSVLVTVCLVGLAFWLGWWGVEAVGLPDPFKKVAKVVLVLAAVIFLLYVIFTGQPRITWFE